MDAISKYLPIIKFLIVFLVFVGFIVGIVKTVLNYFLKKKRSRTLEGIANSMGLSFREKDKLPSDVQAADFLLFGIGKPLFGSPTIHEVMYGNFDDISVSLFNYVSGGGYRGPVIEQTVALFYSEAINLPSFDLRPEGVLHKIGSALWYKDIDFESHPRFSSSYLLSGEDENAIRRIFTYDVLTVFSNNPGLSVEARGNKLIYYRHAKRAKPDDLSSFLHEARNIFELFRESQGR